MNRYRLAEHFNIDQGELAGLPPEKCFVLGVEWAHARARLMGKRESLNIAIHRLNLDRICTLAQKYGWVAREEPIASAEYVNLILVPRKTRF